MAAEGEDPQVAAAAAGDDEDETTPGYKAPAQKSLKEIAELDQEDESLVKYKEQLLGAASKGIKDEGGKNVLVKAISLVVPGREDVVLDLTGDISNLKSNPFVLKEGTSYRLKITFRVQREIVSGLRYHNVSYKSKIKVDKETYMLGSYGPQSEPHTYMTPSDEAPSGMLARGKYAVKSKFLDDDKNIYMEWEWGLNIQKDW